MLGLTGASLVACGFVSLAFGSLLAPEALAETYGLPLEHPSGSSYLRAVGMRDLALGGLLFATLARGDRRAVAALLGWSAFVGATDFAIVAAARGREADRSLAIHGIGTIGLVVLTALVRGDV